MSSSKIPRIRLCLVVPMFILAGFSHVFGAEPMESMKPVSNEVFQAFSTFFQYDKSEPLEFRIVGEDPFPNGIRYKFTYRGADKKTVTGYMAFPTNGTPPYPCMILVHGITGNKNWWDRWMDDPEGSLVAERILAIGYAVVAIDCANHGERLAENDFISPQAMLVESGWMNRLRGMYLRSVVDLRRLLDHLETDDRIDPARFGVLGYSMGGGISLVLSGLDSRVKVVVAGAVPIWSETTFNCFPALPYAERDLLAPVAPFNFAPHVKAESLLLAMGKQDTLFTKAEAEYLLDLISSPDKEIRWYDYDHYMKEAFVEDALQWLKDNL